MPSLAISTVLASRNRGFSRIGMNRRHHRPRCICSINWINGLYISSLAILTLRYFAGGLSEPARASLMILMSQGRISERRPISLSMSLRMIDRELDSGHKGFVKAGEEKEVEGLYKTRLQDAVEDRVCDGICEELGEIGTIESAASQLMLWPMYAMGSQMQCGSLLRVPMF